MVETELKGQNPNVEWGPLPTYI